jgi:hypothetical protein
MAGKSHLSRLVRVRKQRADGMGIAFLRGEEMFSLKQHATVPAPIRLIGLILTGLRQLCQQPSCTEGQAPLKSRASSFIHPLPFGITAMDIHIFTYLCPPAVLYRINDGTHVATYYGLPCDPRSASSLPPIEIHVRSGHNI